MFHSNSQPRKPSCPKALVAQGTRDGLGGRADTLWTLSVTKQHLWRLLAPLFLKRWNLLMTAVLSCPGAGISEMNSKYNQLSGSQLPQVNFPYTAYGKKTKTQTSTTGQDAQHP